MICCRFINFNHVVASIKLLKRQNLKTCVFLCIQIWKFGPQNIYQKNLHFCRKEILTSSLTSHLIRQPHTVQTLSLRLTLTLTVTSCMHQQISTISISNLANINLYTFTVVVAVAVQCSQVPVRQCASVHQCVCSCGCGVEWSVVEVWKQTRQKRMHGQLNLNIINTTSYCIDID